MKITAATITSAKMTNNVTSLLSKDENWFQHLKKVFFSHDGTFVNTTFCPFIEIRNCRNQLNIKALRHGILQNLL